jgi:hypothetical protein
MRTAADLEHLLGILSECMKSGFDVFGAGTVETKTAVRRRRRGREWGRAVPKHRMASASQE